MSALFDFQYPEHLVALQPKEPCRILDGDTCKEIQRKDLLAKFQPGDLLVINNSKVEKRRIINQDGLEILFLEPVVGDDAGATTGELWQVLFPARGLKPGSKIPLPGGVQATLKEKGIPQILELSGTLTPSYFSKHGELALPPYIQAARGDRHNWSQDEAWYQSAWAKNAGSVASPTASLHFAQQDLDELRKRGVDILEVTLHVGAGTFLPMRTDKFEEHIMHKEEAEISEAGATLLEKKKSEGARVWAMGTTACRTIESFGSGLLQHDPQQKVFRAATDLFIYPGYKWKFVNGLLTNFHQPKTTLLALVESFAGREKLEAAYRFAIKKEFRLFSYGDLSVWTRGTVASAKLTQKL